ncbi:TetR/AcrR family transcriptional regulator [Nocardia sp. NPDC056100]|uniref:TetR/AcrR family transcriptional regulator n=1 Tax=Nocardia sp. NPDC056100 TaxID=3345712 RepID=UPI0035E38FA7
MLLSLVDEMLRGPDAAEADVYAERILVAAEAQLFEHGLKRTSLDRIAKAAGVSPITLYRRFANRDVLLAAVVTRDIRRFLAEVAQAVEGVEPPQERIVAGVVAVATRLTGDNLLRRLLTTDPDTMLPMLTTGPGADLFVSAGTAYMTRTIKRAKEIGASDAADPAAAAEMCVRLALSMLLHPMPALADRAHVEHIARTTIMPLLGCRMV